ncbi:ABC transporter transmembrane domain-containing protein [Ferrimonas balearica]|uniref:ABC transporter transmembrane domain-containing protein n=1 Tax=Ferrimonas balearica TaxID=44012 RepID=UPI001C99235A|nr:ABC transporter transmembrane domain-containing protein [Ferrimonas balearica]MBY5920239.1 ATP-binding cassette domain-containing protein [Ferrimonas balearica]MBY5997076.1 ATP-binding cassette domain-containing protein [Ferrimonas balearica]
MSLFVHLGWFFRQHARTYALAVLMLLVVAILNMLVPYLIGQTVDGLLAVPKGGDWDGGYLPHLCAIALALYLLRFGWRVVLFGTSYQLGTVLRHRFYQRLTRQGQAFYSRHNTGDLMARATNDIDAVEMAAGEGILSGFDGILTFLLVLAMMFVVIDWRLALVALVPFPFMGWAFYTISKRLHLHFRDSLEKFSTLNDATQQAIVGVRLVKAMGREQVESDRFSAIANDAAKSNYEVARTEALYDPVIFVCLTLATGLTLGYGAWLIHHNELTVGQLTSFSLYLGQLIWPMFAFGWLLNIVERGSAAHGRIESMLQVPDSVEDRGSADVEDTTLTVTDLTFAYQSGEPDALKSLSLTLSPGQTLGIAGPTGSGKTTLVQLLMRYWETAQNQISLGGKPLDHYRLNALRSAFAYVPQDSFLFSASIRDNIALAWPDAPDEAVAEAARLAAIHEDILRFPEGYQTLVGERGVTLSGGQRQRIAIARALLSRAPILVLDDALSAVDVGTEQTILTHLRTHRPEQSRIIISHRLASMADADEIIVLSHGECSERGKHTTLANQDGWYGRMWTYQQMEAQIHEQQ